MGKRSDFERSPRDYYVTPAPAVIPLVPHLNPYMRYVEPCAGDGSLVRHLATHGINCCGQMDIEPQDAAVVPFDTRHTLIPELVITNPPWTRSVLHDMIENWRHGAGCWLLFDADWMHTKQAAPYLPFCHAIVAIGRLKWIPGTKHAGKDNCCWYFFGPDEKETIFYGHCS